MKIMAILTITKKKKIGKIYRLLKLPTTTFRIRGHPCQH